MNEFDPLLYLPSPSERNSDTLSKYAKSQIQRPEKMGLDLTNRGQSSLARMTAVDIIYKSNVNAMKIPVEIRCKHKL